MGVFRSQFCPARPFRTVIPLCMLFKNISFNKDHAGGSLRQLHQMALNPLSSCAIVKITNKDVGGASHETYDCAA